MTSRMIGVLFAATLGLAVSQTQSPSRREFDVASVRSSQIARVGGEGSGRERVAVTPKSVNLSNASLSFCIQWAYHVKFYQVSGPDWLTRERYDVVAKTEEPSRPAQLMNMMQALLGDRFRLRIHRETRLMPIYELVAPSRSVKLPRSKPDQDSGMNVVNGSFVFHRVTLQEFAAQLSDFAAFDRPVLDRTGVEGYFDITLASAATATRNEPESMFSAVEALGLRLNPRKGPIEMLVIDHADRPSGN